MPDFSTVVLHTPRLTLRALTPADRAGVFDIYSKPEAMRYWSSAPWTDLAQADKLIADDAAGMRDGSALRLAITLTASGQLLGVCNLHNFFTSNRRCELGYILNPSCWGQGYMREALEALIGYGMGALELNRIEADIDPRNRASATVLERLHFQKEGFMRERWIVNGEVCDTDFYGLLAADWLARIQ